MKSKSTVLSLRLGEESKKEEAAKSDSRLFQTRRKKVQTDSDVRSGSKVRISCLASRAYTYASLRAKELACSLPVTFYEIRQWLVP